MSITPDTVGFGCLLCVACDHAALTLTDSCSGLCRACKHFAAAEDATSVLLTSAACRAVVCTVQYVTCHGGRSAGCAWYALRCNSASRGVQVSFYTVEELLRRHSRQQTAHWQHRLQANNDSGLCVLHLNSHNPAAYRTRQPSTKSDKQLAAPSATQQHFAVQHWAFAVHMCVVHVWRHHADHATHDGQHYAVDCSPINCRAGGDITRLACHVASCRQCSTLTHQLLLIVLQGTHDPVCSAALCSACPPKHN